MSAIGALSIDDLFDVRSGGVRLRDWEFEELEKLLSFKTLFPRKELGTIEEPGPDMC